MYSSYWIVSFSMASISKMNYSPPMEASYCVFHLKNDKRTFFETRVNGICQFFKLFSV